MTDCPPLLKDRYREGRVLPFIGAGASMAVEWQVNGQRTRGPSWRALVEQAARLLGFEPELLRARGSDLQILEYFKSVNGGRTSKLDNWLLTSLQAPDSALQNSLIHTELARLTKCRTIYTTNYDNFIERALRLHNRDCTVVVDESSMGVHTETEVVKFHGDFDHPDKMVVTESQYLERLRLLTELDMRFRADLLGRVVLFIGYSFTDTNVPYIFKLFSDQFSTLKGRISGRRAFIAVPDPSDFERRLFEERNIEVIAMRSTHLTEDVAELLRKIRS